MGIRRRGRTIFCALDPDGRLEKRTKQQVLLCAKSEVAF
jgi:hypothetical protein